MASQAQKQTSGLRVHCDLVPLLRPSRSGILIMRKCPAVIPGQNSSSLSAAQGLASSAPRPKSTLSPPFYSIRRVCPRKNTPRINTVLRAEMRRYFACNLRHDSATLGQTHWWADRAEKDKQAPQTDEPAPTSSTNAQIDITVWHLSASPRL